MLTFNLVQGLIKVDCCPKMGRLFVFGACNRRNEEILKNGFLFFDHVKNHCGHFGALTTNFDFEFSSGLLFFANKKN